VRRPQKRPLRVIPVESIPEDLAESLASRQHSIPLYIPLLGHIEYKASLGVYEALDELSTFYYPLLRGLRGSKCGRNEFQRRTRLRRALPRFPTKMDPNDSLRSSTLY
jgi:hypothetical protein